ncbi:hypothetical protein ES319_D05G267600v1 [Gossypium barbadense]|uniref:Uncharacterized protein n=2 Tax=Gossypium TaxID=3633 RepID=A0A5J5RIE9_GOSBA|nr:hypothetical protein ES319_D05G267600v1 [Gossypium barbadense]TYG70064.1 hypothetical protein ES288_D05G282000v1 [Gossypium darwinii]
MGGLAKGFLQSSLAFCPPRTIIEQVLPFLLWSFMEGFDCSSCVPTPEVKELRYLGFYQPVLFVCIPVSKDP